MSRISRAVSLHPYFKVHAGKLDAAKALLPAFVEKTRNEEKVLYYGFSINGDEVFCREAYVDAQAALDHIGNVGELLGEMLKIADLTRLEIHGPAEQIDTLREPLAHLKPTWFVCDCALER